MDRKTRDCRVHVCDRSKQGARGLWNSLPSVYLAFVIQISGQLMQVLSKKNHRAVGKKLETPVILNASIILCVKNFSSSSLNSIFFKKARKSYGAFGILFIITMLAYRLELAITTYYHYQMEKRL